MPFGEGQHYVQLAGGTNDRTAEKLRAMGLIGGDGDGDDDDHHDDDEGDSSGRSEVGGGVRAGAGGFVMFDRAYCACDC